MTVPVWRARPVTPEVGLHRNAQRVQDALVASGSSVTVRELPESAHTVADAAAALGVRPGQIAKSLVFMADEQAVLIVLSGSDRLDPARLSAHLGGVGVTRADADAVRSATGFPIGGVSPVGHDGRLPVLIDRALEDFSEVWVAAGTPHAVFPTTFAELLQVCAGEPVDVRQS